MKLSAAEFLKLKGKRTLKLLTCYDYQMAQWLNETTLDAILIGDTVGEILYGFPNSTHVTMDMMLRLTHAVARGAPKLHIIGDMPYQSYSSPAKACKNAQAFMAAGANSVKVENAATEILDALHAVNIPVCGHVGLTPQSIHDYKRQGTSPAAAQTIIADSHRHAHHGCFALVIEGLPASLAKTITEQISIPTIGIAAGKDCDGQIRVLYDIAGLTKIRQAFAPPIDELGAALKKVVMQFIDR